MAQRKVLKQNLKINLLLLLTSVSISFLIAEVSLRYLGYYGLRVGKIFGNQYVNDEMVSWRMVPNSSWIENKIRYDINAHGWRDYHHDYAKPENTYRIVVVGDSVTYGFGVNMGDIYAKQLEKSLNRAHPAGMTYEIILIAMGLLGTEQEAYLLELEGLKYNPDLIIVGYVLNDPVRGDLKAEIDMLHKKSFLSKSYHKLKRTLKKSSLIYYTQKIVQDLLWKIEAAIGKETFSSDEDWDDLSKNYTYLRHPLLSDDGSYEWDSVVRGFTKLHRVSAHHDIPVILVIFPLLYKLDNYPWIAVHQQVAATALSFEFKVLDLLPYYQPYPQNKLQIRNGDHVHPSPFGHQLASEALYGFMKSQEYFNSQ